MLRPVRGNSAVRWTLILFSFVLAACGGSDGVVYPADVSASDVQPCELLDAETASEALDGDYAEGISAASTTGTPLCTYKDESGGGFINVLVEDVTDQESWRKAAALSQGFQAQPENGPWEAGLARCFEKGCQTDFFTGSLGVTVLVGAGANETVGEEFALGASEVAREVAGRFER